MTRIESIQRPDAWDIDFKEGDLVKYAHRYYPADAPEIGLVVQTRAPLRTNDSVCVSVIWSDGTSKWERSSAITLLR